MKLLAPYFKNRVARDEMGADFHLRKIARRSARPPARMRAIIRRAR